MRQYLTARLAASVALGVFLSIGGVATGAVTSEARASTTGRAAQFHRICQRFLAARTADLDNDTGNAIEFYTKALEFDPENIDVKQRLMVALFTDGRFGEGVALARQLKEDPAVAQVSRLALAVEATTKREYRKAASLLNPADNNPIDRLLNTLLKAWADFGDGKGEEALQSVVELEGPTWYPVFTRYHAGAMSLALGDKDGARAQFTDLIADPQGGGAAPDTYIRTVMALASMEAREGNKRAALDALAAGEDFSPNYAPLAALRQLVEADGKPEPGVKTASRARPRRCSRWAQPSTVRARKKRSLSICSSRARLIPTTPRPLSFWAA
jgi:tetratricopeptide (TPR) repeat protein